MSKKQGAERGMGAGGIIGAKLKPGKKEANVRATTQTAGQLNSFLLYPLRAIPFPVSGKPRPVAFASSDITMQRTHTHTHVAAAFCFKRLASAKLNKLARETTSKGK